MTPVAQYIFADYLTELAEELDHFYKYNEDPIIQTKNLTVF